MATTITRCQNKTSKMFPKVFIPKASTLIRATAVLHFEDIALQYYRLHYCVCLIISANPVSCIVIFSSPEPPAQTRVKTFSFSQRLMYFRDEGLRINSSTHLSFTPNPTRKRNHSLIAGADTFRMHHRCNAFLESRLLQSRPFLCWSLEK